MSNYNPSKQFPDSQELRKLFNILFETSFFRNNFSDNEKQMVIHGVELAVAQIEDNQLDTCGHLKKYRYYEIPGAVRCFLCDIEQLRMKLQSY